MNGRELRDSPPEMMEALLETLPPLAWRAAVVTRPSLHDSNNVDLAAMNSGALARKAYNAYLELGLTALDLYDDWFPRLTVSPYAFPDSFRKFLERRLLRDPQRLGVRRSPLSLKRFREWTIPKEARP